MKDVLNILRFDFLTMKPTGLPILLTVGIMMALFSMFFSPMFAIFGFLGPLLFWVPLGGICDHSGFNKLYGILPVGRKNITRGRFALLYVLLFGTELYALVIIWAAVKCKLYRFLPQGGEIMQAIVQAFDNPLDTVHMLVVFFVFALLAFGYMEMMGQIFGRENEFKVLMITLIPATLIPYGILQLGSSGIIPAFDLTKLLGMSDATKNLLCIIGNLAAPLLMAVFAEITANKVSKREL